MCDCPKIPVGLEVSSSLRRELHHSSGEDEQDSWGDGSMVDRVEGCSHRGLMVKHRTMRRIPLGLNLRVAYISEFVSQQARFVSTCVVAYCKTSKTPTARDRAASSKEGPLHGAWMADSVLQWIVLVT